MREAQISIIGRLATDPTLDRTRDGVPVCRFRVASQPSRFDRSSGNYVDGTTMFFSVSCWRSLAESVADSLHKGDPVIVTGRLELERYTDKSGQDQESWRIIPSSVGPDLTRSRATVQRARRPDSAEDADTDAHTDAAGDDESASQHAA